MAGFNDLFKKIQVEKPKHFLENSEETWRRLKDGDTFPELELKGVELKSFLETWAEENEYLL